MNKIVLDASVVLKWYLPDEKLSSPALELLDQYVSEELEIMAPTLLEYEVVNGLTIAQKRGRIKENIILKAVKGFINLDIKYYPPAPLYPKTIQFTRKYDISFYDASYLSLAHREKAFLITADNRLLKACQKDFKWIKQL